MHHVTCCHAPELGLGLGLPVYPQADSSSKKEISDFVQSALVQCPFIKHLFNAGGLKTRCRPHEGASSPSQQLDVHAPSSQWSGTGLRKPERHPGLSLGRAGQACWRRGPGRWALKTEWRSTGIEEPRGRMGSSPLMVNQVA